MDPRQTTPSMTAWEQFPAHGNTYLYARILDWGVGEGCVEIDVKVMATDLALAPRTCKDHIRKCNREGFFRTIEWLDGGKRVRVYYSAMVKVLADRGITENLVASDITIEDLKHKKVAIAAVMAKYKQEQSRHCCEESTPGKYKGRNPNVKSVGAFFGGRTSFMTSGGTSPVQFRTKRFSFVPATTAVYGASQDSIAAALGRSTRTIRRRLSAPYARKLAARFDSDLKPIPKMQIAVDVGPAAIADFDRAENFGSTRLIQAFGRSWNPKCNLYWVDFDLRSCGRLNRGIQRHLKRAEGEA